MAIDSAAKRKSALAIALVALGPVVVPSGGFEKFDRQVIGYGYGGIAADTPAATPPTIDPETICATIRREAETITALIAGTDAQQLTATTRTDQQSITTKLGAGNMTACNLKEHRSGDTWPGLQVTVLEDDEVTPVDLTGATSILMQVKAKREDTTSAVVFSLGAGITITDAANGVLTVDKAIVSADPGDYHYDIEITLSNGDKYTPLEGIWPIVRDVSR